MTHINKPGYYFIKWFSCAIKNKGHLKNISVYKNIIPDHVRTVGYQKHMFSMLQLTFIKILLSVNRFLKCLHNWFYWLTVNKRLVGSVRMYSMSHFWSRTYAEVNLRQSKHLNSQRRRCLTVNFDKFKSSGSFSLGPTDLTKSPQTNRMRYHGFFAFYTVLETKKAWAKCLSFFA